MADGDGVAYPGSKATDALTLPARPEAIRLSAKDTAVVVIDMQNAYASPGGYLDLAGFDISGAKRVIERSKRVLETARRARMPVIFFQNGWDEDYVEAGGPGSPNYHKSNALKTMRERPELQGKLLARGGWDYELVDGLKPQPGDIVLHKTRYSGFFNSQLDSVLQGERRPPHRLRRHRHQRLCGIHPSRRLLPGILRRHAGGRHPPGGTGLPAAGQRVQHREILWLGLDNGGFLRRLRPAAASLRRPHDAVRADQST